jgi:putative transposase
VSVAGFVAAQRAEHGVPHACTCRVLEISESWFYKWRNRRPTPRQRRRAELVAAIRASFEASDGSYGSPRIVEDLWEAGWQVSVNTVAKLMSHAGLVARPQRHHRKGLTRADKRARRAPDLVGRDFSAEAPNVKWCGDFKQIDTGEGPLYLGSVEDLFSRRLLGFAMSEWYPTAELAKAAIHMAVAVRGGDVAGVIFHSDQGTQGGFNWLSQHLVMEVMRDGCGQASAGDSCDAGADVVAGSAVNGATRRPSAVLGSDRSRRVERGCSRDVRRVIRGWDPLVP